MKRILVTGSQGQLGRSLYIRRQSLQDAEWIFSDRESLPLESDNLTSVIIDLAPDIILHCAAYTAVDKAEGETELARRINTEATKSIAEAADRLQALLIYISTDFVYDGEKSTPYIESDMPNPISQYGKTKWMGENAILASGARYIILRTSWVYAEFGHNFLATIRRLLTEKTEVRVVFDQIGTPTYAGDIADFLIHLCALPVENQTQGIYHFSNEGVAGWYDFAHAIRDVSGFHTTLLPILTKDYPTPAKRPAYSVLNKEKVKITFQWSIPHWRDSLVQCIAKI